MNLWATHTHIQSFVQSEHASSTVCLHLRTHVELLKWRKECRKGRKYFLAPLEVIKLRIEIFHSHDIKCRDHPLHIQQAGLNLRLIHYLWDYFNAHILKVIMLMYTSLCVMEIYRMWIIKLLCWITHEFENFPSCFRSKNENVVSASFFTDTL